MRLILKARMRLGTAARGDQVVLLVGDQEHLMTPDQAQELATELLWAAGKCDVSTEKRAGQY